MIAARDMQGVVMMAAAGAVVAVVLWVALRGPGQVAQDTSRAITKGAGDLAGGLIEGAIKGAGDSMGLPDPKTESARLACCVAVNRGEKINASLNCEYSQFMDWIFRNKKPAHCKTGGGSGSW
jgi:hypothetical protein